MIIRVLTDNQYRLPDELVPDVDRLDDAVMTSLKSGDEAQFDAALHHLVDFVRGRGTLVPAEELVPSDGIIPPPDMTLIEVRDLLEKAQLRMPTE